MWKALLYKLARTLILEALEEVLKLVRESPEENPVAEQIIATKVNQVKRG